MARPSMPVPDRLGLFAAVLTPAAVMIGWLLYFALNAGWNVLYAATFGALMALLISAIEHYLHTARHERAPAVSGQPRSDNPHAQTPVRASPGAQAALLARAGAIMFAFIAIVCEDLAKELVREMLRPCLLSVITLLPAAFIFMGASERDDNERTWNPIAIIARGFFIGLLIAGAVALVRLIAGESVQFWQSWGWWSLVGLGFSLIAFGWGPSLWRPLASVLAAMTIVLVWSVYVPAPRPSLGQPTGGNIITTTSRLIGLAVDYSLSSPDLPSQMWSDAKAEADERRAHRHNAEGKPAAREPGQSTTGAALARWCGCPDIAPEPPPPVAAEPRSVSQPVVSPDYLQRARPPSTGLIDPSGGGSLVKSMPIGADTPIDRPGAAAFDDSRQSRFCHELRQGFESGMVRSWTVMLLFALGLGIAPRVERATRPADYPSSRTRHHDRLMAWGLAVLVVGGALVVRFTRPSEPAEAPVTAPVP